MGIHATQTRPSVGLRDVEVQQSHFMGGPDRVEGVDLIGVPMLGVRANFVHGKFVGQFTQHLLHLVELEVDHALPTGRPDLMLVNAHVARMVPFR